MHFPFFAYFRKHTSYDYYWIIEYDVRFTGRWNKLFDHFRNKEADFISTMLRRYKDHPKWPWWELTHPLKKIGKEERIRCFTPLYRISYAAANYLDNTFAKGWKGHAEVIILTLLNKGGFSLMDFGGSGEFVKGKSNKFYTNFSFFNYLYTAGTFKYRPVRNKAGLKKTNYIIP